MIYQLFKTPSSFEGSPLGFVGNQVGHAVIVGALPAYFMGWPAALVVSIYAVWEFAQWRFEGADAWDCWQDWAFVASGALAVMQPLVAVPMAAQLVAGYLRRR